MRKNKNSFTAKLVKVSYPKSGLPNSICPYFWKALFAYITLPLTWPIVWLFWSHPTSKENGNLLNKSFGGVIIYGFIIAVSHGLYSEPLTMLTIIGIILLIIGCIIGIIYLIDYIYHEWVNLKYNRQHDGLWFNVNHKYSDKKGNLLVEYIKAKKAKMCNTIEWIDEDKQEK